MNELENKRLDQKSWAWLNLLGQSTDILINSIKGLIQASGAQFTGLATAKDGTGVEIRFDTGTNTGAITCYDRTNLAYKPMAYDALSHVMEISGILAFRIDSSKNVDFAGTVDVPALMRCPLFATSGIVDLQLGTNSTVRVIIAKTTGQTYLATDNGVSQTAAGLFAGTGVPTNANGNNGDFYFRSDGGAGTCIYQRRAGAWVATGA